VKSRFFASKSLLFAVALAIPPGRPAIEIKGFRMVESKQEKRQMELVAETAKLYKPEDIMALSNLNAQLWGKGKKPYLLNGKIGVIDSNSQDFKIFEDSEVRSPEGYLFETLNVRYNSSKRILISDDDVQARPTNSRALAQFQISGTGFVIHLDSRRYEILKNVKTQQKMSPKNSISIRSKTVIIDPGISQATFQGNVSVKSPTIDMKGERLQIFFAESPNEDDEKELLHPQKLQLDSPSPLGGRNIQADIGSLKLQSKGLAIDLSSDGSIVKSEALGSVDGITDEGVKLKADTLISDVFEGKNRIILKDSVEILTDDRLAKCQDAVFFPDTGDIVLERVASVKTDQQLIEGEIIRFSTKNSEISVEKAKGELNKSSVLGP